MNCEIIKPFFIVFKRIAKMQEVCHNICNMSESVRQSGFFGFNPTPEEVAFAVKNQLSNPFLEPVKAETITIQSPEGLSHQECIADFYEAWKMPDEVERRQGAEFFDVFVSVRDKMIDRSLVPRLTEVMKQYHWLYFGSDTNLPDGVAIIDKDEVSLGQTYSQHGLVPTEVSLHPNDPFSFSQEIYRQGLHKLDSERTALRLDTPKLAERYQAVISSSPQYQFLKSFSQDTYKYADRQLTIAEKQIQTSQAEAEVRRKHGLQNADQLNGLTSLAARQELGRKIYQIDDITKQSKLKFESPVQKAKQFFLADMQRWAQLEMPATIDEISSNILVDNKIEPFFRERYAEDLNVRLGGKTTDIYDGDRLIGAFLDKLFNGKEPDNRVEECLEYSLSRCVLSQTAVAHLLSERFIPAERLMILRGGQVPNRVVIKDHGQELKPVQFFELHTSDRVFFDSRACITTKEDYEAKQNHVLSYVERSEDLHDAHHRLIEFDVPHLGQRADLRHQLAKAPTDWYDLKLTFSQPTSNIGRILGYDLVAVRDSEMYFTKSFAHDPYELPDRFINDSERQRMIEQAELYGADELATFLASEGSLSVVDLVSGIRRTSDYSFDESINSGNGPVNGVGLKSGRLQMQCDGAAVILRSMIDSLDDGFAVIVGGQVLDANSNVVSASSHVEVEWHDSSKKVYRLDATPGQSNLTVESQTSKTAQRRFIGRLITKVGMSKVQQESQAVVPVRAKPITHITPVMEESVTKSLSIDDLVGGLELNLQALVGVNTSQDLYKKTIELKEADPVRRTLEAAIQLRKSPSAEVDLAKLNGYLGNLSQADDQMLKKLGITKYQSGTLQMLQSFVQQLSSLSKV